MPSLDDVVINSTKLVMAPGSDTETLYDLWSRQKPSKGLDIERLGGCGSDYCSFVCHLGVPSVDLRFTTEDDSSFPTYHRYLNHSHSPSHTRFFNNCKRSPISCAHPSSHVLYRKYPTVCMTTFDGWIPLSTPV